MGTDDPSKAASYHELDRAPRPTFTSLMPHDEGSRFARATSTSATSPCTTSRPAKGRWSFCCTASPSSGSAGGCRSRRSPRRASGSLRPTRAATTCPLEPEGFEAYSVDLLADDIRGLIQDLGAASAHGGRPRLGRNDRLDARHEPSRGGRPPRHPQRRASPQLSRGCTTRASCGSPGTSSSLRFQDCPRTWFTPGTGTSSGTSCTPPTRRTRREEIERYVEAWSQPGAASGMINYYRSSVQSPAQAKAELPRSRRQRS